MSPILHRTAYRRSGTWDEFDLSTGQRLGDLQQLLNLSGSPSASLHFEMDDRISKRTLTAPYVGEQALRQTSDTNKDRNSAAEPRISSLSQDLPSEGKILYSIASYTKILLNVAYYRVISAGKYKHLGLSWTASACDVFNELRRDAGKPLIRRFSRDPSILELLLHRNGFAPMNQYLLAPDGSFIMSKDEFLEAAPLITEDFFRGQKQGSTTYSNANHIFAAIVLEEVTGQQLHEIMQEEVFVPLKMEHTAISNQALQELQMKGCAIATGHRISGNMTISQSLSDPLYLCDSIEAAAFGAYSCTEDLAKLIRELLKALDGASTIFSVADAKSFFGPKCDYSDGVKASLAGLIFQVDSVAPGFESSNKTLSPSHHWSAYKLGIISRGRPCEVYYKAGTIDGFSCSVYISLRFRAFVIALANSSGPLDITAHMAHYCLQEALDLSPKVDIVQKCLEQRTQNSRQAEEFEDADSKDLSTLSDDIRDFVGRYTHIRYGQTIVITGDGNIRYGRDKISSHMKARRSAHTLRVLPGSAGFGIDRWTDWKDRDYVLNKHDGKTALLKGDQAGRYEQTDEQKAER